MSALGINPHSLLQAYSDLFDEANRRKGAATEAGDLAEEQLCEGECRALGTLFWSLKEQMDKAGMPVAIETVEPS